MSSSSSGSADMISSFSSSFSPFSSSPSSSSSWGQIGKACLRHGACNKHVNANSRDGASRDGPRSAEAPPPTRGLNRTLSNLLVRDMPSPDKCVHRKAIDVNRPVRSPCTLPRLAPVQTRRHLDILPSRLEACFMQIHLRDLCGGELDDASRGGLHQDRPGCRRRSRSGDLRRDHCTIRICPPSRATAPHTRQKRP